MKNGRDLFSMTSKPHHHSHSQFVQNVYSPGLDMFYDTNFRDPTQQLENLAVAPLPQRKPSRPIPKKTPNGISLQDPALKAAFEAGRNKWLKPIANPSGLLALN